jgi:hypothetical protein
LRLGATRDDIRALFGEPDQVGGVTRKHKQPRLWKYGPVEFHFGPDDRLFLVYLDSGELERRTILRDPPSVRTGFGPCVKPQTADSDGPQPSGCFSVLRLGASIFSDA